MALYTNIIVPVPDEAQVCRSSGRVYLIREKIYDKSSRSHKDKRLTIGKLNSTDGTTMNPNSNYAIRYPIEFDKAANGQNIPIVKRAGLYVLSLCSATDSGLYSALIDSCGPAHANFLMDFAMYSVLSKSNVAKDFEPMMADQLTFSQKVYSDSWISDFFSSVLTKNQIEDFKARWVHTCIGHGRTKVWLCIDGSNNDCCCEDSEMAEKGKAKSRKSNNIYSYMYAVDAEDGTPVYYTLERGGKVDSKSFQKVVALLKSYGLEIEGVILDRGFCDSSTISTIVNSGYKYIIMLQNNVDGFKQQLKKYGGEIRNNAEFLVAPGIFACTHQGHIFKNSGQSAYLTLAYDCVNGAERVEACTKKVLAEKDRCEKLLKQVLKGEISASDLPSNNDLEYTQIQDTENGRTVVLKKTVQEAIDRKGFSCLACSEDYSPKTVLEKYDLRDQSEKQFMILKTQLGYYTGRSHQDEGIEGRHLAGFIAGVLRNDIANKCEKGNLETTRALRELNFLVIQRVDNFYIAVKNANMRQKNLLKQYGLAEDHLDYFAQQETRRFNGEVVDQIAKLPDRNTDPVSNSSESHGEGVPVKRKPGRPKGSRNKVHKEKAPKEPKKRGRPPGSKNRPKEVIEAEKAAARSRRGQPNGAGETKSADISINKQDDLKRYNNR